MFKKYNDDIARINQKKCRDYINNLLNTPLSIQALDILKSRNNKIRVNDLLTYLISIINEENIDINNIKGDKIVSCANLGILINYHPSKFNQKIPCHRLAELIKFVLLDNNPKLSKSKHLFIDQLTSHGVNKNIATLLSSGIED